MVLRFIHSDYPFGIFKLFCRTYMKIYKKINKKKKKKRKKNLHDTYYNNFCVTKIKYIMHKVQHFVINLLTQLYEGPSWSWSYGCWIYNYLCNQCLSPLTLWVGIPLRRGVIDTTLCDKSSVSGSYRPITPYFKPFSRPQLCSQPWLITALTPFHRVSRLYEFLSYCLRVFHVSITCFRVHLTF
jgi:hypothetical protein